MTMLRIKRYYSVKGLETTKFSLLPLYKLTCGLEIHTQLDTKKKLFSQTTNDPFHSLNTPNVHTSYFDVALPGTQPLLNYEAVLCALKLSVALGSQVNLRSQFDRKHYFYGDQPLGYQITQHYKPFASGGKVVLRKDVDGIDCEEKTINLIQLQIEQDTGRSVYRGEENRTLIDLNRSNVPLIEMVTQPDFSDLKQIRAFIKKYQNLVRHLNISTGDLETGAMRVDVNLSVNDYARVELKNLPNTSSIMNAIKSEYQRQVQILEDDRGEELLSHSETRLWNGECTVKLRSKETTIDYRYMPDPELPVISLSPDVVERIEKSLPPSPDEVLRNLMAQPYNLSLKDAKILTVSGNSQDGIYSQEELLKFYLDAFKIYSEKVKKEGHGEIKHKLPTNWIIHELLGNLNKLQIPLGEAMNVLNPKTFAEFLTIVHSKEISSASGKLLLFHILEEFKASGLSFKKQADFKQLIEEYDLQNIKEINGAELKAICQEIIDAADPKMIKGIVTGKKRNSIKFLVGQGMRSSQGRIQPQQFEQMFESLLCRQAE